MQELQLNKSLPITINLELLLEKESRFLEIIADDLVGDLVTADDVADVMGLLAINYEREPATEAKARLLFEEVRSAGWSGLRLKNTAQWIIRHHPYPTWNVATFFDAPQKKIHTYTDYLKCVHEKGKEFNYEIHKYRIGGKMFWSYKSDGLLPFELIDTTAPPIPQPKENVIQKDIETFTSKVNMKPTYQGRFLSEDEIARERERQLKLLESFDSRDTDVKLTF